MMSIYTFNKIKNVRIMLFLLIAFCCTSCSAANEAMDGETEGIANNVVMKDSSSSTGSVDETDKNSGYMVLKGKIKGVDSLAKPEIYFPANSNFKKLKNETKEEEGAWEDKAGNYLLIEPGRVLYSTKEFYDTFDGILFDDKGSFRDNFNEILKKGNVWGVSEEKAVEMVQSIVEKNKISVKDTKAYSLTKGNLTKLSKMFMSDKEYEEYISDPDNEPMKRVFTEKDEGYLVVMSVCAGENALYPNEYEYGERYYPGSLIWAIVNKDGLVTFQADGIYDVDKDAPKEIEVLSLEQAKDIMNQKFKNIISSNKPECKEIEQSYLAVNDGKSETNSFIPVYIFHIEQKLDDVKGDEKRQVTEDTLLILDMENGKWIE